MQSNIAEETLSIHRDGRKIMDTRLARISQLSCENPNMVFTSIGHMIDKRLLRQCHAKMDGNKAVGIDGITKEDYEEILQAQTGKKGGDSQGKREDEAAKHLLL